ncbi:MAG TPA: hypothetical protein VG148_14760 [Pyrinomonadaceae bacterium]|nr:hypothetical protein [Pyrinomonadaceae bacterium]
MSNKLSVRYLVVLPVLAFLAFAVVVADFDAFAQNTNTTTNTGEEAAQNENTTTNTNTGRRRRGRRGRRATPPANDNTGGEVDANANAAGEAQANVAGEAQANVAGEADANANMTMGRRGRRGSRRTAGQETDTGVTSPGERSDLSGTYTGRVRMTGGHEMSGDGTLTITGDQFTLSSEGMSHTGRIIAITTRGYTGATLYFSDITDSATNTPLAASVRARHGGSRLTLTPVPGEKNRLWFNSGGGGGERRRRGRRGRRPAPPATGTEPEGGTTP